MAETTIKKMLALIRANGKQYHFLQKYEHNLLITGNLSWLQFQNLQAKIHEYITSNATKKANGWEILKDFNASPLKHLATVPAAEF